MSDPKDDSQRIPAITELDHLLKSIGTPSEVPDHGIDLPPGMMPTGGGMGTATAYSEPHIQFSSPDGIVALTPKDAILSAGNTMSFIAGQDINLLATGNYMAAIKEGLSIFTVGKLTHPDRPVNQVGIMLHAASGSVSVQAQDGPAQLTADKHITIASTHDSVNIAAKGHVLLTAGGAYIKLEGGNIEIHAPGMVEFHATMKELAGPQSSSIDLPNLPKAQNLHNDIELLYQYDDLESVSGAPYKVRFEDGTVRTGTVDAKGHALVTNVPKGGYTVEFGEDARLWKVPAPDAHPEHKKASVQATAKALIDKERIKYEQAQGPA
jgi:type VI secretion system secreted protein VgrG